MGEVFLPKVQIVLTLNMGDVAFCSVCKVAAQDEHLRILDNITTERAVRRPRTRLVRIPFDPFESRHCEHIYVIESLVLSEHKTQRRGIVLLLLRSPQSQIRHICNCYLNQQGPLKRLT